MFNSIRSQPAFWNECIHPSKRDMIEPGGVYFE